MGSSRVGLSCLAVVTVLLVSTSVRSEDVKASPVALRGLQENSLPEKRPRIIGGTQANQARYPYYALMKGTSLCGAALISPRFVLTAAHCRDADQVFEIGPQTFINGGVSGGVTIQINDRAVHPLYNEVSYENDLALFELKEDAPFPYVRLSPDEILSVGEEMTVVGFGDVDEDESVTEFAELLQQTNVNYVSNTECRRDHRGEIEESMICAEAPGQDACYGDSGGPLLLTPTESVEDDLMVGIVSWGRGCANENFPGVYTRISYFYDWIVGTMCVLNASKAPPYVDCNEIMGFAPTDAPVTGDVTDIREEDILSSEAPTTSPTAAPTASPTASPSANPTSCGQKGDACEDNSDCCSNRCNIFDRSCSTGVNGTRNRLSSGFGGSAGGTILRTRTTAGSTTQRAKLRTRATFDHLQ